MVHRRVVAVGEDAQTRLDHFADRLADRPFFVREGAKVVRIGRDDREDEVAAAGFLHQGGIVRDRVAVVDAFDFEKIHRGFDVAPVLAKFARVGRDAQSRLLGEAVGLPEVFRFVSGFTVVDPNPEGFGHGVANHFLDHEDRFFGSVFAVDGGNETAHGAALGFGALQAADDGLLTFVEGIEVLETRRIPEVFDVAHAQAGDRHGVFVGDALEKFRTGENVRFKRAENAKDAHGFVAAGEEAVDFLLRDRSAREVHEVFKGRLRDRAEQVAVQFGLGETREEIGPGLGQGTGEGRVGDEPRIGRTHGAKTSDKQERPQA